MYHTTPLVQLELRGRQAREQRVVLAADVVLMIILLTLCLIIVYVILYDVVT